MAIVKYRLDAKRPPKLTRAQKARIDHMGDDVVTAAARSDADNPPLTKAELAKMTAARSIKKLRAKTGLSQAAFAKRYRIGVARLRDLEQGRYMPDSALLAYFKVIEREPTAVKRALES